MNPDIEITYFSLDHVAGESSDLVAYFSAKVNGFTFRRGVLRRSNTDGGFLFVCSGRGTDGKGISLSKGPLRAIITEALADRYYEAING